MPAKAIDVEQEPASRPLTVEDLAALLGAMNQQVPAPAPTPEQIASALGLTVSELEDVREDAIKRGKAAKPVPDVKLETPVRVWCDKYKSLKFLANGKRRKFSNGKFLAETQNELDAIMKLTQSDFIFVGDDVTKPIRCRVCNAEFRNSEAFQDHMSRHIIA